MTPRIRAAVAADAAGLPPLLAALGYPAMPGAVAGRLEALLATGRDAVLVAEGEGALLGVLVLHFGGMLHLEGPVARIGTLVVAEAARGGGIGGALLHAAEALARARGCGAIELTTGRARQRTHAFYEAQGYAWSSLRLHKSLVQ